MKLKRRKTWNMDLYQVFGKIYLCRGNIWVSGDPFCSSEVKVYFSKLQLSQFSQIFFIVCAAIHLLNKTISLVDKTRTIHYHKYIHSFQ